MKNASIQRMVDRGHAMGFEWRAQTGRWRWLILGALGSAPFGCGGQTGDGEAETTGVDLQGNGGAAGSASPSGTAMGGAVLGTGDPGASGTGSGGSGATTPFVCAPPLTDLGGGWEQCGNGMIHRQALGSCPSSLPRPEPTPNPYPDPDGADAGVSGECRYDSDCTQRPNGHCESDYYSAGMYCAYGCVTNAECDPGFACVCGDPVGTCVAATCATDAECGAGLLCSDFIGDPGCGGQAFACQTAADSCGGPSDCPEEQYCTRGRFAETITPDAARYCSPAQCVVGRPFLVAGHERLATAVARSDWYPASEVAPEAGPLSPELREAISKGWLEQALMEHASVAAFARFSLQLLALGAPAELCSRAAAAMQDEIQHARACFELARRHAKREVGPGPLDLTGALDAMDLEAVVLGTIAEGCVGETVAAIEAAEALEHCDDAAARAVLARIAEDETRHAELAWRFVAWALETGPVGLRDQVRAAFVRAARVDAASVTPSRFDRQLAEHGLIAPSLRAELRRRVLRDVIEPCARALVGAPASHPLKSQGRQAAV